MGICKPNPVLLSTYKFILQIDLTVQSLTLTIIPLDNNPKTRSISCCNGEVDQDTALSLYLRLQPFLKAIRVSPNSSN